jgi:hypothetical protein
MRRSHHHLLLAGLALLTAAAMAQPARAAPSTPTPERWLPVTLGAHSFSHLHTPRRHRRQRRARPSRLLPATAGRRRQLRGPKSFDLPRDGSL